MSSSAAGQRLDLTDPDNFVGGVPHDEFARLRREGPVSWHPEQDGPGFWAVTRAGGIRSVSRDPQTFSSERGATFISNDLVAPIELMRESMLNMDPPRHTRYRRIVTRGFTPRMINRLEAHVRDVANDVIDRVCETGACDLVADLAVELPLQIIAELLGVPPEDRAKVFEWSNRIAGFDDPSMRANAADGMSAIAEGFSYAHGLATARLNEPHDDLATVLVQADVDGERLTDAEFALFFLVLAVAGNETTRNTISGGGLALMEQPEQRELLLRDPSLIPSAVEEMLRWVSPVMYFRRTATCDTELGGQRISDGDKVVMWYISGNRDEREFPDPFRFDVRRQPNDHVAFGGGGNHHCLGANLARLELRVFFEELLARLPDLEVAGPIERTRSNWLNGIKRLPVRFTPSARRLPS